MKNVKMIAFVLFILLSRSLPLQGMITQQRKNVSKFSLLTKNMPKQRGLSGQSSKGPIYRPQIKEPIKSVWYKPWSWSFFSQSVKVNLVNEMFEAVKTEFEQIKQSPDDYFREGMMDDFVVQLSEQYGSCLQQKDSDDHTLIGKVAMLIHFFVKKTCNDTPLYKALDSHLIYNLLSLYTAIAKLGVKASMIDKLEYVELLDTCESKFNDYLLVEGIGSIPVTDILMLGDIIQVFNDQGESEKDFFARSSYIRKMLNEHPDYSLNDIFSARKILDYGKIIGLMNHCVRAIRTEWRRFGTLFDAFVIEKMQQAKRAEEAAKWDAKNQSRFNEWIGSFSGESKKSIYGLLEIPLNSSPADVKKAYHKFMLQNHSDIIQSMKISQAERKKLEEKVKEVNVAYGFYIEQLKRNKE